MQINLINPLIVLVSLINWVKTESFERQLICGKEICDASGGVCTTEGRCKCYEGYITGKSIDNHLKCNYEQVSSFISGMIELLTGIGLGHLYAGRKENGVFKLFCVALFCGCCVTSLMMMRKIREESEAEDHPYVTLLAFSGALFKIVIIIWQIVDALLFFLQVYKDGMGLPLY